MKKAIIVGPKRAEVIDVSLPKAKDDWAVVKIHSAPMCTEYKAFNKGDRAEFLGHEAAGEVVDVAQAGSVKVGDRVVVMPGYPCGQCDLCIAGDYIHCEHGHNVSQFTGEREGAATYAQYLIKPMALLPKIPEGVPYDLASLACCGLGPSFGAFDLMDVDAFDTVLITGLGPVGMGAVINARFRGAKVIAVDALPYRANLAMEMGASAVINPSDPDAVKQIKALTKNGAGPDKAIDCAGVVAAHRLCIDSVRRKGKVAFVGECSDDTPLRISPDMIRKGITLIGSWHYNINLFPKIMQVIQQSPLVPKLISHTFPLSDIQHAFEVSASPEHAKIILKPWA
jgi:threonine dehydrogenase-like Zn-dependent dehydrogenase